MMYRQFVVTECPRCPDLVLSGTVGGVRYRIDRRTVPVADAAVLRRYGFPVLVLDRRISGMHADWWVPGEHDLNKSNRHLVTVHACHSAHADQPVGRPATYTPAVMSDVPGY